jgi:succinoglycan biosynthesis transport protein ExoP
MEQIMDETNVAIDLKGVIRRRKKGFFTVFFMVLILCGVIAFALPPVFKSVSTILIEEQQIPTDFVKTTITSYVEERIQTITQEIMSRTRLLEIINRFGLYPEMQGRKTTEEIIEEMRGAIHLETISTDVIDKRTGRSTAATIAFTLSYEGKDPSTVQKVANVLASLYLEENLKSRERRASDTTAFLQEELDGLKKQVALLENKITEFKKAHMGELPEYGAVNMQNISKLNRDLDQVNMQLRSLRDRKVYLEGQLANVDPLLPLVTDEGKKVMNPTDRLKYLRLQLISLQSTLSGKHPDIIKLKKQIAELEVQVSDSNDSLLKVKRLDELKNQLADMTGRLGPKHPDVVKLKKEVDALSKEVGTSKTEKTVLDVSEQKPDNPAYINLRTQIASAEMEMKSYLEEKQKLTGEINDYQRRIANAPLVEKEYIELTRDYETAKFRYNEIMNKLMEAKVSQGMEESQRGERFTIVDPAQLPEKPYKPNRVAILLIGLVLAIGSGVGLVAVKENLDHSVKTREDLLLLTGARVLSTIPYLESEEERSARRRKKVFWVVILVAAAAGTLVLVHLFVMPLDILWKKVQRRLSMDFLM